MEVVEEATSSMVVKILQSLVEGLTLVEEAPIVVELVNPSIISS